MVQRTTPQDDVEILQRHLPPLPEPVARPVLIVVSGLPGTGKSYFSRSLAQRLPLAVLETDLLRKTLFPLPSHTAAESARLFKACHQLIGALLKRGHPLLLDATNLVEAHREPLYHIAKQAGARLILVQVEAPEEVVQARLAQRGRGGNPQDHSDAAWEVYQRMRSAVDPIGRNHHTVDTSKDILPVIEKILKEVRRWQRG